MPISSNNRVQQMELVTEGIAHKSNNAAKCRHRIQSVFPCCHHKFSLYIEGFDENRSTEPSIDVRMLRHNILESIRSGDKSLVLLQHKKDKCCNIFHDCFSSNYFTRRDTNEISLQLLHWRQNPGPAQNIWRPLANRKIGGPRQTGDPKQTARKF